MELKIKKLTINDLDKMIALQKRINDNLAEDEKHFILPKSRKEFTKALTSDSYFIAGIFDQDNLIAQSTLVLPKDNEKREMSEFAGEYKNSDIAIYKTIMVDSDPKYRHHGFMKKMLEYFEAAKEVKARKIAIIQIAVDNPASWISAMKNGMQITKVGLDPEDNAQVLYLQKKLEKKQSESSFENYNYGYNLKFGDDIHKTAPILFNKMCKLSETMVGSKWCKETKSIIWEQKETKQMAADKILFIAKGAKSGAKLS